jgi:glycosyltransferase involved in cell wall biosynthesis
MPYPPKDGGSYAIYHMALGLADFGHNVTIIAVNTPKHYVRYNDLPDDLLRKIKIIPVFINTHISTFKALLNLLFSSLPYNIARFISINFKNELKKQLSSYNYDIIQIESLYMVTYIPVIRKYSKSPISFRSHNIEYEIWEKLAVQSKNILKKTYFRILSRRIKRLEIKSFDLYDLLLPISEIDAQKFLALGYKKPYTVIPVGIELNQDIIEYDKIEHPSVFFLGSLDWIPNQEGIIWFIEKVWPKIVSKYPDLKLYIAGRNASNQLQNKLKGTNIVFEGEVDDARQFMKTKSIMIVPLFSGSGIRIKIIEGMWMGKSIVTTTMGAEGIPITHKNNIMIADNEIDFEKCIDQLISDEIIFLKISRNARQFIADNFNNKNIIKTLISFYLKHIQWQ